MSANRTTNWRRCLAILMLLLTACDSAEPGAAPPPTRPLPTLFPTSAAPATPAGQAVLATDDPADTGWMPGDDGVELRRLRVAAEGGRPAFPVVVARIDPARVRVRVGYTPEQPRALRTWFDDTHPLL